MTDAPQGEERREGDEPTEHGLEPFSLRPAQDLGLGHSERLRSLARERGLVDSALGLLWWTGMRLYLRVYHRLRVEGAEHLPRRAPFVLIANHTSHLDAMTLGSVLGWRLRNCVHPVAAGEHFFESPAAANFAAFVLNALPLWRRGAGRYALQQLRDRLVGEPCGMILFPEGTRSRSGEMAAFKSGLGMVVAGLPVPVVPCHLAGAHAALPPQRRLPRPRRLRLRVGQPFQFDDCSDDREGWKRIAESCEDAIRALARGDAPG